MIPSPRPLLAVFRLTLRAALRERVVLSMLALLGLLLALLPSTLRGDGTVAGALRMHIRYSLGFSSFLLACMTLWMSCASVASELSTKRLQMLLSKPLSRATLWWGKWLAISCIVTTLLLLCGAVTFLRIQSLLRMASADELADIRRTLLTARAPTPPLPEDLTPILEMLFREHQASGALPPEATLDQHREELASFALVLRHSVRAGSSTVWRFDLGRPVGAGEELQLAYQFDGSSLGSTRVPGVWRVGTEEQPALWSQAVDKAPQGEHVLFPNAEGKLSGASRLVVSFEHQGEEGSMIFFRTQDGVRLFRPAGDFTPNLLRALGLIAGLLCLLAAIGVVAGALFSLPVACYVTAVVILLQALSGSLRRAVEEGALFTRAGEPSAVRALLDRVTLSTYRGVLFALRPVDLGAPLERVARGVLVSRGEVARRLGLRMTPSLLVIAAGGILLFNRREIGGAE